MLSRLPPLTLAAVLGATLGCGTITGPEPSLTEARARWALRGPASYTVTMVRSCECTAESSGPVTVTVRDGATETRVYTSSGLPVGPTYADVFPTVEGLFALVDAAIRDGTTPLVVRFHPALGYPTRIELGDPAIDAPVYVVTELRSL